MPFEKGNKFGKIKPDRNGFNLKLLCQHKSQAALDVLVELLQDKDYRFQAAVKILEWGHGKPQQIVEMSGKNGAPLQANIFFGVKPPNATE